MDAHSSSTGASLRRRAASSTAACLALAWLLAGTGCGPSTSASPESTGGRATGPSVVLVTIDTLRADHLGCYGYARPTSPRMDAFCAEAVRFETAITPTPTTDPAHSSIMTGLYPANHGVLRNGWRLDGEHETLAELLHRERYQTMAAVSVRHLTPENGFGQGFDRFFGPPEGRHHIDPPEVSARSVEFIETAEAPFFLWVHFWDPHGDYNPPEEHDRFAPDETARDLDIFHVLRRPEGRIDHVPSEHLARIASLYDGEIRFTDSHVGRVLDALREKGVYDDALVVISSDHGELMDEIASSHNYAFDHGEYLLDGNLRVPLMMKLPGGRHGGTVVEDQVSNMDILPTVAEALDLRAAEGLDGVSLLGAIEGTSLSREPIFLQRRIDSGTDLPRYHEYGVRTASWKYIIEAHESSEMLYDLTRDPGEKTDVKEAHPEVLARLRGELEGWRAGRRTVRHQIISEEQAEALEALGYIQ